MEIYKEISNLLDSIELKINVLDKYKKHFNKEELIFINKSRKSREIFEDKSFNYEIPINNNLLKQDLISKYLGTDND